MISEGIAGYERLPATECVADLDQWHGFVNFEPILTPFEASIVFDAAGAVLKIGSGPKLNHHREI
jgi:hypothetical protein